MTHTRIIEDVAPRAAINVAADSIPHDEEIWFDNLNVVLISKDRHKFRLPNHLLARVSPVLSEKVHDAQRREDVMDGCPVVRLDDDSNDLRNFLQFVTRSSLEYVDPLT